MIRKRSAFYNLVFDKGRSITTCTLPLEPPNSTYLSLISIGHKSLCFSLTDNLVGRGQFSAAQQVIRRIITTSLSVSDAITTVDFANVRGLDLDMGSYGVLIRKLVELGQPELAADVYFRNITARGIDPGPDILNSMVICLVKLGKLQDARAHFDRLMLMDCVPCRVARNAVFRALCVQERFLEAFYFLLRFVDANVKMDIWCYNMLIDGLCCKGYVDEGMQVFDIMRERTGLPPTLHLYKSLFYSLCKKRWAFEAESLFWEMESQGFFVDKVMYTSLMNAYSKDKKMKMAMRVYLRMLKIGCEPDTYTCNTLIHGFVKIGLFDKGWVLHNQMTSQRMQFDVVTYQVMISNYCKQGKVDCASMVLKNMLSCNLVPNVHCYTVLIAELYKENRLLEVDELYRSMMNSGVVPDHILFLVLMKNSPKGRELHLALMILLGIAKNGCGFDPSAFSISAVSDPLRNVEQEIELVLGEIVTCDLNLANVAFSIVIGALCEGGKMNAALLCLDKMVRLGCSPSVFTYNSLIKCLFQGGLFEDARSLIGLMQEQGMGPDMSTYLIMVNEHCKRRDLASAIDVFVEMEERGLKPNVNFYDSIIACLSRERRMFDAEDMFKRMLETAVDPDEVVYMTMINGYFRNGRPIEARELFERMIDNAIRPSSYSYTALISGLVKRNMTDKGCLYLDRMLEDGFMPNAVLYTSLIKNFLRKGDFEFAFRLVDLMDRNQIEPDLVLYIALVSGVCRNLTGIKRRLSVVNRKSVRAREMLFHLLNQRTLMPLENSLRFSANSSEEMKCFALKLVQKVKKTRFMPNLYLYNGILSGFCGADRMQDAYEHFELMQKEGVHPNQVTFTILMSGHIRVGEIDRALELFNKMNVDGCTPDRIAYNTLLKGLCKAGRLLDALSLSYTMKKRGFFPSRVSYGHLLGCLCASDLGLPALKIFEEMLDHDYVPHPYSCNQLLCILCQEKKLLEAHIVYDVMLKRGWFPALTKRHLLEAFYKQRGLL